MTAELDREWTVTVKIGRPEKQVSIIIELERWSEIASHEISRSQCIFLGDEGASEHESRISEGLDRFFTNMKNTSSTPFWKVLYQIIVLCSDILDIANDHEIAEATEYLFSEQRCFLEQKQLLKECRPNRPRKHLIPDVIIVDDPSPPDHQAVGRAPAAIKAEDEEDVWVSNLGFPLLTLQSQQIFHTYLG